MTLTYDMFRKLIENGEYPVVQFTLAVLELDDDIVPDPGMKGRVRSVSGIIPAEAGEDCIGFIQIKADLSEFEEHNRSVARIDVCNDKGVPTKTIFEAGLYPADGIFTWEQRYNGHRLEIGEEDLNCFDMGLSAVLNSCIVPPNLSSCYLIINVARSLTLGKVWWVRKNDWGYTENVLCSNYFTSNEANEYFKPTEREEKYVALPAADALALADTCTNLEDAAAFIKKCGTHGNRSFHLDKPQYYV